VPSSGGGQFGGERGVFVEQLVVLEAVVELAEQAVEEVALGGRVPVADLAAPPIVATAR
jgi:hypothetical protein